MGVIALYHPRMKAPARPQWEAILGGPGRSTRRFSGAERPGNEFLNRLPSGYLDNLAARVGSATVVYRCPRFYRILDWPLHFDVSGGKERIRDHAVDGQRSVRDIDPAASEASSNREVTSGTDQNCCRDRTAIDVGVWLNLLRLSPNVSIVKFPSHIRCPIRQTLAGRQCRYIRQDHAGVAERKVASPVQEAADRERNDEDKPY